MDSKKCLVLFCRVAVRNSTHYLTQFNDVGLSNSTLVSDLTFAHAQMYFVEAECENHAGLSSRRVQSQRVLVDATPPPKVGTYILCCSFDKNAAIFHICTFLNKVDLLWYL